MTVVTCVQTASLSLAILTLFIVWDLALNFLSVLPISYTFNLTYYLETVEGMSSEETDGYLQLHILRYELKYKSTCPTKDSRDSLEPPLYIPGLFTRIFCLQSDTCQPISANLDSKT